MNKRRIGSLVGPRDTEGYTVCIFEQPLIGVAAREEHRYLGKVRSPASKHIGLNSKKVAVLSLRLLRQICRTQSHLPMLPAKQESQSKARSKVATT